MPLGKKVQETLHILGPSFLVSVAYIDPGNWATAIEGGSRFGYELIWVVVVSNLIAILLQTLAARLGIVTGKHLAEVCREQYPQWLCLFLWFLSEISIIALDLTMVLGTAVGINLLFKIPMLSGIFLTSLDFVVILFMVPKMARVRFFEVLTVCIIGIVFVCFLVDVVLSVPPPLMVLKGFLPTLDRDSIYTAVSLLGANVMPHNFYLHSALVKGRNQGNCSVHALCRLNFIDVTLALGVALLINMAVLVVSASVFHSANVSVVTLQSAHDLMEVLLSSHIAPAVFGLALLFASQLSTFTGTISAQVVLKGFLNKEISPWIHRLLTRTIAILPAAALQILYGDEGTYKMLVIAQVILAIQLPFTLVPLIKSTSEKRLMGSFTNSPFIQFLAWSSTLLIFLANLMLLMATILPSQGRIFDSTFSLHEKWISTKTSNFQLLLSLSLLGGSCLAVALLVWMIITPVIGSSARSLLPQYTQLITSTIPSNQEIQTPHQLIEHVVLEDNPEEIDSASKTTPCRLGDQQESEGLGKGARRTFALILDSFWSRLYDLHGQDCHREDQEALQVVLENTLLSIHQLKGCHQVFAPRLENSWSEVNHIIISRLHEVLQGPQESIQLPFNCPQCGFVVLQSTREELTHHEIVLVFGLWSLENLLNLCYNEPRPELWGKYGSVLNRLQWILPLLPCRIYQTNITKDHLSQLLQLLERSISTKKGQKGTPPASTAYPKGKEIIMSIVKRYRRQLSIHSNFNPDSEKYPHFAISTPMLLGNVFFTLLTLYHETESP